MRFAYTYEEFEKWAIENLGSTCMYCRLPGDKHYHSQENVEINFHMSTKVPMSLILGHQLALRVALLGLHPSQVAKRVADLMYSEEGGLIAQNCVTTTKILTAVIALLSENS